MDRMRASRLDLNPAKREILLLGGDRGKVGGILPVLDGMTLPLMVQVCSFGCASGPESLWGEANFCLGQVCLFLTRADGTTMALSGLEIS